MKKRAIVVLLTVVAMAQSAAATLPAFTIGKDTTLISGPLRADGTIDYIPAINKLLNAGLKNDANAAIPLLILRARNLSHPTPGSPPAPAAELSTRQILEALHVAMPAKGGATAGGGESFWTFMAHKKGAQTPAEVNRISDLETRLKDRPWKPSEFPEAVEWMKASEPGLKLVEDACGRPGFYIPFREGTKAGKPTSALEGQPPVSLGLTARDLLLSRAMMRAGSGDLPAALEDLRRIRVLARLQEQEHESLFHLVDLALELTALRGYAALANSTALTGEQLAQIRKEIEALPDLADDPQRAHVEEMLALDMMMQCIRGQSANVMRLMAFELDETKPIDIGDWANADWDAVLKEVVRIYSTAEDAATAGKERSFSQQLADLSRRLPLAKTNDAPSTWDTLLNSAGKFEPGTVRVEAFLKRRPGESRPDFSRRVTRWLVGYTPSDMRQMISLDERPRAMRVLALTAVSLAQYHLAHGEFPETLEKLGTPLPLDGFSSQPLHYRRQEKGYALWSVGVNQKDDAGTGDDLVVKASGNSN